MKYTATVAPLSGLFDNGLVSRVNRRSPIRIVTGRRRLPLTTWRANVEPASLTHNGGGEVWSPKRGRCDVEAR